MKARKRLKNEFQDILPEFIELIEEYENRNSINQNLFTQ